MSRLRRWLRATLIGSAFAYPALLLVVSLLLRFVGEAWWPSGVALYLPRLGFALPLLPLTIAILLAKRPRLLWPQLASVFLLIFPLLGMKVSLHSSGNDARKLKVLSYNVNSGYGGFDQIAAEIERLDPDIVLVQELFMGSAPLEELLRPRYPNLHASGQFLIASRLSLVSSTEPERLAFGGAMRSPRFMKYVVKTPLGDVTIFNVHPVSPRGGIGALRGQGFRREILSGRLLLGTEAQPLQATADLRREQIETVATLAARETGPVIIAGDTNLPGLSPIFARYLGGFRDGFAERGTGFGYSYPTKLPFMRIDRILTNERLRFVAFQVGSSRASDHFPVVAELVSDSP